MLAYVLYIDIIMCGGESRETERLYICYQKTLIMIVATETVKRTVWYAGDVKQDGSDQQCSISKHAVLPPVALFFGGRFQNINTFLEAALMFCVESSKSIDLRKKHLLTCFLGS